MILVVFLSCKTACTRLIITALLGYIAFFSAQLVAQVPTIKTYEEVENPIGPAYYDPVLFAGQPYTGILIDRKADGRLAAWKQVKNGLVDGWWMEWFPNGALRYRGHWKAGVQSGEHAYFYENGLPREVGHKQGEGFDGLATTYLPDGSIAQQCGYLMGQLSGTCMVYAVHPPAAPVTWSAPSQAKTVVETYVDGRPKLWREENAAGQAEGLWLEWLEDGTLRYRAHWRAGKGEGLWTYFHDDGRVRTIGVYRADTLVGEEPAYE